MLDVSITHFILIQINILCLTFVRIFLKSLGLLGARAACKFVRLYLSCYVMRTLPHKHQFCAVLFSRLPLQFTRLHWSCFVVCVFRFTWFCGVRLVNAGFVAVSGCFYLGLGL